MLKNCVFKPSVNTVEWARAAAIRAVKTMAQAAVATIGTTVTMGAVDWKMVASTSMLAGVVSVLTSIAGVPEVKESEE